MLKHIEELHQHVSLDSSSLAAKQQDWRIIVRRVSRQLCLRIVTCCQIASKLNSHYKVTGVLRLVSAGEECWCGGALPEGSCLSFIGIQEMIEIMTRFADN